MLLTIIGCGDAFGSGGRLQTSYHVQSADSRFLIDCGATALIGLERAGLDPDAIPAIFLTHLHGDHFAGLCWWLLHAQHVSRRSAPLTVTGPVGTQARVAAASEALFPGSSRIAWRFPLTFIEYAERQPLEVGPVRVTPYEVAHPAGAPPYALRFEIDGKVLSFSGDTEWVEALRPVSREADLHIAECYAYDGPIRYHTSWEVLSAKLPSMTARRVLLTHMSHAMLARSAEIRDARILVAKDEMVIEI